MTMGYEVNPMVMAGRLETPLWLRSLNKMGTLNPIHNLYLPLSQGLTQVIPWVQLQFYTGIIKLLKYVLPTKMWIFMKLMIWLLYFLE
jgi:hypothetical protein